MDSNKVVTWVVEVCENSIINRCSPRVCDTLGGGWLSHNLKTGIPGHGVGDVDHKSLNAVVTKIFSLYFKSRQLVT